MKAWPQRKIWPLRAEGRRRALRDCRWNNKTWWNTCFPIQQNRSIGRRIWAWPCFYEHWSKTWWAIHNSDDCFFVRKDDSQNLIKHMWILRDWGKAPQKTWRKWALTLITHHFRILGIILIIIIIIIPSSSSSSSSSPSQWTPLRFLENDNSSAVCRARSHAGRGAKDSFMSSSQPQRVSQK